ncbi:FMN-dependent NADH-azoreductase 2 [Hartmannibacter diazotrophicus]|uniref:FMN-dependent NADH-azoreductase 2 n=1 Tax=Hartmannibacter diazotrophicus TaxID=1482074 RepID=A0A2C9DEC7_9HYPH|nr:NAD(P)H-dependent oxidoreductase [Hartmannibacter diazotrophicus]SON58245.1 FMN-dependent NADH-azoreductase 2 [Hartmannibacter diazotrophicus]
MRVLVVYSHPVETSFCAAIHKEVVDGLKVAGHEVDDCDLYAENFSPVLTREERIGYHDIPANRANVEDYCRRLEAAEALIIVSPVWNFGWPAMLKGYFDRVFLPGVSFRMENGIVKPNLQHIKKLGAFMTYGGTRMRAFLAGDPPRKIVRRVLRIQVAPFAPLIHHCHYDMNRSTPETRAAFLEKVRKEMGRF